MKRALGKTSLDRPAERWLERDEEDLERCTEEDEEEDERAIVLKEKIKSVLLNSVKYVLNLDISQEFHQCIVPPRAGSCQTRQRWITARTPILPWADTKVGSQLWHFPGCIRVRGRARGFLSSIPKLGWSTGGVAA